MKECFVQKMHTWVLCVDMEFNIYRFSKLAWVVSFVKKPWDGQKVLTYVTRGEKG